MGDRQYCSSMSAIMTYLTIQRIVSYIWKTTPSLIKSLYSLTIHAETNDQVASKQLREIAKSVQHWIGIARQVEILRNNNVKFNHKK